MDASAPVAMVNCQIASCGGMLVWGTAEIVGVAESQGCLSGENAEIQTSHDVLRPLVVAAAPLVQAFLPCVWRDHCSIVPQEQQRHVVWTLTELSVRVVMQDAALVE